MDCDKITGKYEEGKKKDQPQKPGKYDIYFRCTVTVSSEKFSDIRKESCLSQVLRLNIGVRILRAGVGRACEQRPLQKAALPESALI